MKAGALVALLYQLRLTTNLPLMYIYELTYLLLVGSSLVVLCYYVMAAHIVDITDTYSSSCGLSGC